MAGFMKRKHKLSVADSMLDLVQLLLAAYFDFHHGPQQTFTKCPAIFQFL